MKYDFTICPDRRGKDAVAVEPNEWYGTEVPSGIDTIPMWVADMNFKTLPDISEQIVERAKHPLFGYFAIKDEYYDSIINWQKERNGVTGLSKEHIGYENGVLGGVVSAMKILCEDGGPVLLNSPAYIGFTHCLEDNGYNIVLSEMVKDEEGIYRLDLEDMERKIVENHIHVAIFCSPHNPTGRVFERWEIESVMELYARHDVYVISDEIWSDLTLFSNRHIPTQSISEDARKRTIAFYAPSKTFNLSGLIGSYHICYNSYLRDRLDFYENATHYNSINVLSQYAAMAAFSANGQQWLDELRAVLAKNVDYACDYIKTHFKGVSFSKPQGTYMLYIDCKDFCKAHNMTLDELWKKGVALGVLWQDGRPFHNEYGIRLNLALPFERLKEAFDRLNLILKG